MARISEVDRPGWLLRACCKIGERMFGKVPIPSRLMAHRPPLMFGLGALDGVMEWFGKIDELTFLIGYQTFASKFAKAFQSEPQGFSRAA